MCIYTERTARCGLHLPGCMNIYTCWWQVCTPHLSSMQSSPVGVHLLRCVHKASKAAAIFNVVFGLRVYYRLCTEGKIQLLWSDPTFVWSWSFHLWLSSLHPRSLESGESEARSSFLPAFVRLWISSPRWDCRRGRCHPSNECVPSRASSAHLQHSRHSAPLCPLLQSEDSNCWKFLWNTGGNLARLQRGTTGFLQLLSEVWAPHMQNVWDAVLWRPQDN